MMHSSFAARCNLIHSFIHLAAKKRFTVRIIFLDDCGIDTAPLSAAVAALAILSNHCCKLTMSTCKSNGIWRQSAVHVRHEVFQPCLQEILLVCYV